MDTRSELNENQSDMRALNRSAFVVAPKQPFLDWLHAIDATSAETTLEDLRLEHTIYLVPECEDDAAVTACLREVYAEIFEEELYGWWTDEAVWPIRRTFGIFQRWFDCRFDSVVIDLSDKGLKYEPF